MTMVKFREKSALTDKGEKSMTFSLKATTILVTKPSSAGLPPCNLKQTWGVRFLLFQITLQRLELFA